MFNQVDGHKATLKADNIDLVVYPVRTSYPDGNERYIAVYAGTVNGQAAAWDERWFDSPEDVFASAARSSADDLRNWNNDEYQVAMELASFAHLPECAGDAAPLEA